MLRRLQLMWLPFLRSLRWRREARMEETAYMPARLVVVEAFAGHKVAAHLCAGLS